MTRLKPSRDEARCQIRQLHEAGDYYGDYFAPGLFLIDLAWHLAVTGDKEFFLSMRDKMLATLEWRIATATATTTDFTNTRPIGEDRRAAGLLAEAAELKRRFNQTF